MYFLIVLCAVWQMPANSISIQAKLNINVIAKTGRLCLQTVPEQPQGLRVCEMK